MQVDPIKPTLTAPGTHLFTLKCDEPLSTFAFKFNSRRYTKGFREALEPFGLDPADPAFWTDAINAHLGSLMEEAEGLAKKLDYA